MPDTNRQVLLILWAEIVSAKPFDPAPLDTLRRRILESSESGDATAVEAAGHVAFMQAYTKVTDTTGKAPIPKWMQFMLPRAIRMAKYWSSGSGGGAAAAAAGNNK